MILGRVRIESWGCLRWPLAFEFSSRLSLIYAPNESGKSTLITAIRYALLEPITANVERYRPWGSDMVPRAEIDFLVRGDWWRVEKQFGRRGFARLSRKVAGVFEPFSDDPKTVHARTVELLTGAQVEQRRGRASSEDMLLRGGLLYVLWREQGVSPLSGLKLPATAEKDLAEAIGAVIITARDRQIIAAVQSEFSKFYSAKEKRESGQLAQAAKALAEAEARRATAVARYEEMRRAESEAANKAYLAADTGEQVEAARRDLTHLAEQVRQVELSASALKTAESRLDAAKQQVQALGRRIDGLQQAQQVLSETVVEIEREAATLEARETARKAHDQEMRELEAAEGIVEAKLRATEMEERLARQRLDLARWQAEQHDMERRLREMAPLEQESAALRQELVSLAAPDESLVSAIELLDRELAVEEAKLSTARSRLSLVAKRALEGSVQIDGQQDAAIALAPGESATWDLLERVTLELAGACRVQVDRTLETSTAIQQQKVEQMRGELGERLKIAAASTSTEARQRCTSARNIEATLSVLAAQIEGLCKGGRSVLERELAILVQRSASLLDQNPELQGKLPSPEEAEAVLTKASQRLGELRLALQNARSATKRLRDQVELERCQLSELEGVLQHYREAAENARGQIAALEDDGMSVSEREQLRVAVLALAGAQEAEVGRYREEVAAAESVCREYETHGRTLRTLEAEHERYRADLQEAQMRAAMLAQDGAYTSVVRAEEQAQLALSAYARVREQADAVRLLAETLLEEQERARTGLFAPVQERVASLFAHVSEGRYTDVRVTEDLKPTAVVPRNYPAEKPAPDVLSGGAQEQLGLLVRLALADTLASGGDDPQTLILDEPLPFSDPLRRRHVLEVLSTAGPKLQIIVLANDRRDYASLNCDSEWDLGQVLQQAGEGRAGRD